MVKNRGEVLEATSTQSAGAWEPRVGFQILDEAARSAVHGAALEILDGTGCLVENEAGLAMLRRAGARVEGARVRLGAALVEKALASAPRNIVVGDREGRAAMELGGRRVYFGTGSDCVFTRDLATGERRKARRQDVVDFALVSERLEHIAFVMSMALPEDVPGERLDFEEFAAMLLATRKPITFTALSIAGLDRIRRLSEAAAPSPAEHRARPHLVLYAEPVSPLKHIGLSVEKLLYCAQHGLPVTYSPGSMGGGTIPITCAGAVAISTAEILSGLVIHQLARPGAPFIFGGAIGVLDMSSMVNAYGPPEAPQWGTALAEMGRGYGLPTWSTAGCSDSKLFDGQATAESALTLAWAALGGANLVHDVGYLESGMTSSLPMLVAADEQIGVIRRMAGAVRIDREALAVEAIARVGPGGNFLADEHTLEHFRAEHWFAGMVDRRNHQGWLDAGGTSYEERCRARARELLAGPHQGLADAQTARRVRAVLDE
jgi:trimethylamine--corrinoid protein Co-methyltransferase